MTTMKRSNMRTFMLSAGFVSCAAVIALLAGHPARAQDNVTVDLGALDAAAPQMLISDRAPPVTLKPPPGVEEHEPSAITLTPPPSMVKRTQPAPETQTAAVRPAPEAAPPPRPQTPAPAQAATPPKPAPAPPAAKPEPAPEPEVAKATPPAAAPTPAPPPARTPPKIEDPPLPKPVAPGATENITAEPMEEVETAAVVEPPRAPRPPDQFTIDYGVGDADVPKPANQNLAQLARRMVGNPDLRVEFIAYASDREGSVSRSRRLSLERAVNVRKMLLDAGVDSSRVNLRAMGEQSGDGDPDRIDVLVTTR